VKGITLYQPWASLVAVGAKRIETRSWFTSYRGTIAIHAGDRRTYAALKCGDPLIHRLLGEVSPLNVAFGAIVAVATLTGCYPTVPEGYANHHGDVRFVDVGDQERALGIYTLGRYAWPLANIQMLKQPIPCRGRQRLWNVPEDIAEQLRTMSKEGGAK
jgi:activating signal cointegrator 1